MQYIGPFLVLSKVVKSRWKPVWCYLVYDDANGCSMQTAPVKETGVVPDWDSQELSVLESVPKKIDVLGYVKRGINGPEWTWVTECMAVQGRNLFVYSSIMEISCCMSYITNGQIDAPIPSPSDLDMNPSDFLDLVSIDPVSIEKDVLKNQYNTWLQSKLESLPQSIKDALSTFDDKKKSLVERVLAISKLHSILSNRESPFYISVAQLYFNGRQFDLDRYLNSSMSNLLNELSDDEFHSTVNDLFNNGWSPQLVDFHAYFLLTLHSEKSYALFKMQAVQDQVEALFCAHGGLAVNRFVSCNAQTRKIIFATPKVKGILKNDFQSFGSLIEVQGIDLRDEIVKVIGIDVVKTWLTDLNSLETMSQCTKIDVSSQLIWDRVQLLVEDVNKSLDVSSIILTFFANSTRTEPEILQKITEFVNTLSEIQVNAWLSDEVAFNQVISHGRIKTEQKIDFLKIPRIYAAITKDTFISIMNSDRTTLEKAPFFHALFPEKIKKFIEETSGDVLRYMSTAQRAQARTAFSVEELQNRRYLFQGWEEAARRAAPIRDIQSSLLMRILTNRATPYVGVTLLLAGVALLMMTSNVVLGASLAAAGGLMLFGSFRHRDDRALNVGLRVDQSASIV